MDEGRNAQELGPKRAAAEFAYAAVEDQCSCFIYRGCCFWGIGLGGGGDGAADDCSVECICVRDVGGADEDGIRGLNQCSLFIDSVWTLRGLKQALDQSREIVFGCFEQLF